MQHYLILHYFNIALYLPFHLLFCQIALFNVWQFDVALLMMPYFHVAIAVAVLFNFVLF